jgi:hypothetical protein
MTTRRTGASQQEVFTQQSCHPSMNPKGLTFRECRDSVEHPQSVAILFALDVSGSMGEIPFKLATSTLPTFMKALLDAGIADPQVLFGAIGYADGDRAPLQVGQFESTAQLMDQWLTRMYLEGGGGGGNESYELAMYIAARHTIIDCHLKRGRKGFLFITGDEPPNEAVVPGQVAQHIGTTLPAPIPLSTMIAETSERWEVFYLIPDLGRAAQVEQLWRPYLGDRVIAMHDPADTSHVAAALVALVEGAAADLGAVASRLQAAGAPPERIQAILAAITPFAATLRRDGTPTPR